MADEEREPARLQVANMRPDDSGRGLARLPRTMMNALGLGEGDVIELIGKRSTPARAILPYPEDEGLNIIRLDGLQRANAEIGSGDFVEIRKAQTKHGQRAVLAPRIGRAAARAMWGDVVQDAWGSESIKRTE